MKWLATHWTTIAMAVVLSLVTVGLLSEPSQVETLILPAQFRPDVRTTRVGSIEYWLENSLITDRIPVTVTGDRRDFISLVCQPILDESKFPTDETARETTLEITPRDFGFNAEMMRTIRIRPFTIQVRFAPMTVVQLPVQVSPEDVQLVKDSRHQVESIRAFPSAIRVRLPVDKAQTLTFLRIRPIISGTIMGKTETVMYSPNINTELPEYKDVRRIDEFTVRVEYKLIEDSKPVEGIPLFLSSPVIPEHKAELVDLMSFKVVVSGAKDLVKMLSDRPDLITVHARVERAFWKEGIHQIPVKCDVPEEFRKDVTVKLAPGEPLFVSVRVIRS